MKIGLVYLPEEAVREEDLSTQYPATCSSPWFPPPHVHSGRSKHPSCPSATGPCPAIGLILPIRDRSTFGLLSRLGSRVVISPLTAVFVSSDQLFTQAESPPLQGFHHPQVAFAVPRKVGNAVVRNRIRRRLRAVLQSLASRGQLPNGAWLFIVRAPRHQGKAARNAERHKVHEIATMEFHQLEELMVAIVERMAKTQRPLSPLPSRPGGS